MKKCKGCGEILQYTDKAKVGYAPNESFDYCQRCFRLTHYGDLKGMKKSFSANNDILNSLKDVQDALYVYIIDCFDALYLNEDNLINHFLDMDLLIIINKIDLLPRNITDDKLTSLYQKAISKYSSHKNIQCVLTYKNDQHFNDIFFTILNEKKYQKALFFGRVNAGKSSLINKLIANHDLTTSIYPGTTTNLNEIKFNHYTFIDSPGLLDEESFVSYIDNKLIKNILPLKTIKAQNFQLYHNQAYFVEGLLEVVIKPLNNASVCFMINNNIEVHRTKAENAENYLKRQNDSFKIKLMPFKSNKFRVDKLNTFYLKGLGLCKIKGKCEVEIKVNEKIRVYVNEVNI